MRPAAAAPFPRFRALDVFLTAARLADVVGAIGARASDRSAPGASVCVFAADSLLKCRDDPRLAAIANDAWMTLCDGMPLVLLARLAARLPAERCYGPDVMLGVLDRGRTAGLRHYFYGGADEETSRLLQERMEERFPGLRVVGRPSGLSRRRSAGRPPRASTRAAPTSSGSASARPSRTSGWATCGRC